MKRLITTSLVAVMTVLAAGSTAAVAQPYQHDDHGYYHDHPNAHRWHHGDRFYGDRRPIDWRYHHLYAPPYGYEWVDGGGAFLLLNLNTGYVAKVVVY